MRSERGAMQAHMTGVSAPNGGSRRQTEHSGVLLIDKPLGMTSHDVVDLLRCLYGLRQIGHTGTLDPAASGLMLTLLGRATKIAPYLSELPKCYLAHVRFGLVSDTGDSEGRLSVSGDPAVVSMEKLADCLRSFVGEITQKVPAYSAARSDGRRRYELARSGHDVPELARQVTVSDADLIAFDPPVATVRFRCSSGTYIRSLAESLGEALGCGAHLAELRREEVGQWTVSEAFELSRLSAMRDHLDPLPMPRPIEEFLILPLVTLSDTSASSIRTGPSIMPQHILSISGRFGSGETAALCDSNGRILAVVSARFDSQLWPDSCPQGGLFRYRRVLA